jgi:hypothetical protein
VGVLTPYTFTVVDCVVGQLLADLTLAAVDVERLEVRL